MVGDTVVALVCEAFVGFVTKIYENILKIKFDYLYIHLLSYLHLPQVL